MGNQMWPIRRNCPSPGKSGGSRLLSELDRGPDFPDADEDFRAQVGGGRPEEGDSTGDGGRRPVGVGIDRAPVR